ncbi:hypothetical protein E4U51_005739 [Claviceps purpurea]|nr:hypothetical protein E4U51_005739 [Claviceps purpurea]
MRRAGVGQSPLKPRSAPSGVIKLRQASSTAARRRVVSLAKTGLKATFSSNVRYRISCNISSQAYGRTHISASHVVNYRKSFMMITLAGGNICYLLIWYLLPVRKVLPAGHPSRLVQRKTRLRICSIPESSLTMASDRSSHPDARDTAVISNRFVATHDSESREEESSTDLPASAAVQAVEAPPIAVGSRTDDDYGLSSVEGDDATASLTSSLLSAHTIEYGRRYPVFGDIQYALPIDEMEQSREDMKHAMLMMLTENKPFLAPIGDHPQKILDIGTGTGIWAIDVGDRYPSAKVRGIDIAPIQPEWVPPNVTFVVDDCAKDWIERDADLAHFRYMIVIFKETSKVLGHAFESLRPGGWIELQEMLTTSLCDDGTMPDDDPVKYLCETATKAFEKCGMETTLAPKLEPYLREAGFEKIHCQIFKVPIGPWAKDKTMRIVGLYQKIAVEDGLPFLTGRPFQALEMSEAEAEVTIAMARKGLDDPTVHRYFNYYFWYAQKPGKRSAEQGGYA